jgi:hypothetical protein
VLLRRLFVFSALCVLKSHDEYATSHTTAEGVFEKQFASLMSAQNYAAAMQLAADSPQGVLRTLDTINQLKAIPATGGTTHVLQYFQLLLKKGALNAIESIELARPVLAKRSEAGTLRTLAVYLLFLDVVFTAKRIAYIHTHTHTPHLLTPTGLEHIKGWLKEQKLEASEELGDMLKNHNIQLALSVFLRAKCHEKVVGCFLALGAQETADAKAEEHFKNIFAYSKRVTYTPDFSTAVTNLMRISADRAKDFALLLLNNEDGYKLDITILVHTFMQANDVKNTTNILVGSECSCYVHLCSLHSAHANLTINLQLLIYLYTAGVPEAAWRPRGGRRPADEAAGDQPAQHAAGRRCHYGERRLRVHALRQAEGGAVVRARTAVPACA